MLGVLVSVLLATARNIFSKNISDAVFGKKEFFLLQCLIFSSGGIVLSFSNLSFEKMETELICYSLIYGILLLMAQYGYTLALKNGKIGICSMVYSMGFIFPTICGSLLWEESVNCCNIFGIALTVAMIITCGIGNRNEQETKNGYFLPLITAMLSSGGLRIVQKLQQSSKYTNETNLFLILAFWFAGSVSLAIYLIVRDRMQNFKKRKLLSAALIGGAFGLSNLCNTILSGQLKAAVFFPLLNIGTIVATVIIGVIVYKEKCTKKDIGIFAMGILAVILLKI